jgi:hypothetical protein
VSLPCEWSWAIRLYAATVVAPYWDPTTALMQMLFRRKKFEDGKTVPVFAAPDLEYQELLLIS